jgi:hypothetical protein
MKKQSILALVTLLTIFVMSSCNNFEAKEVKLNSQNDSLNYTLGLSNGKGIKDYYLQKDSSDKAVKALFDAMDDAFNAKASEDEMYKIGKQIGNSFKQQQKDGLMGDSTLVFDLKIVRQGLLNALNRYSEGMTPPEAESYIRTVMSKIQEQKEGVTPSSRPQPAPSTETSAE